MRTVPIPVRLKPGDQERLREVAKRLGASVSGLMRFAVIAQLPSLERRQSLLTPVLEPAEDS
jgi:hypothetical protein